MVTIDNLTVSYRQHPALHHISGVFAPGSLTAVVGPNGSGKSTLLKAIMGLVPTSSGSVNVSVPCACIAYLPQLAEIDRGFPMDVQDCVLLGCWAAGLLAAPRCLGRHWRDANAKHSGIARQCRIAGI